MAQAALQPAAIRRPAAHVQRAVARAAQAKLSHVVQRSAGYKCKVCGKWDGYHYPWCSAKPEEVVEEGLTEGTHYVKSTAKGKGAVAAYFKGSEFTGSGKGCAEPKLLSTYATNKSGDWLSGITLAWTQNTLPCHKCHALLQESSGKYSNTYVVTVEDNLGKPYGYAHGLPDDADTVITYQNGTPSYSAPS